MPAWQDGGDIGKRKQGVEKDNEFSDRHNELRNLCDILTWCPKDNETPRSRPRE